MEVIFWQKLMQPALTELMICYHSKKSVKIKVYRKYHHKPMGNV